MKLAIFVFVMACLIFCAIMDAHAADKCYSIKAMATPFVGATEAAVVEAVCYQIGAEESIDPYLIAAVWRFENGFHKYSHGYYTGALQLSPHHVNHMKEYGFDRDNWKDQIRYGVHLWRLSADKHKSLYATLQPWGVRRDAMALYHRQRGTYDHWASFNVKETAPAIFEGVTDTAKGIVTVQNLP